MRILWGVILSVLVLPGLFSLAEAKKPKPQPPPDQAQQVDNNDMSNNSRPASGVKVDTAAVAELTRAQGIYAAVSEPGVGSAQLRDALKIALAQVEKFQQTQDYDHLVDCLFLIGNCYYELGEWASAEKFMSMCYELGTRYFPDVMGTAPLKIIGESQYQQKKNDDALKTFQSRVQKIQKQGSKADQGELAGALFDVAGLMINLDRAVEALPLLQQAESANAAAAGVLAKPDSKATLDEKDANVIDHAEIVYHQAIALFHQNKLAECRPKLESALGLFSTIQDAKRENVADRMVAVLDDLVKVCESLGDKAASDKYKAQRDKLNQ